MDGSLGQVDVQFAEKNDDANSIVRAAKSDSPGSVEKQTKIASFTDTEPNNDPADAQLITLPARVDGVLARAEQENSDIDLFQFNAKAGEEWIVELNAVGESPVDAHVAVLHEDGRPVLRTNLQAVRDSYFTFRGKDSTGTGDFRLHNWREMKLNEYLYASGEVVKLYHYPRGPDSGFNVYPNFGTTFWIL